MKPLTRPIRKAPRGPAPQPSLITPVDEGSNPVYAVELPLTILVATHDLGLLRRMRGRMLSLRGGQLISEASLPLQ